MQLLLPKNLIAKVLHEQSGVIYKPGVRYGYEESIEKMEDSRYPIKSKITYKAFQAIF